MARPRLSQALTIALGVLYVGLGAAETVRVVSSGDGGLWFWFGTLVGGGSAILVGVAVRGRHPHLSTVLVCLGALAGVIATAWTLVVPILAVAVVFLALRGEAEASLDQPE